jgi:hypothetical protein
LVLNRRAPHVAVTPYSAIRRLAAVLLAHDPFYERLERREVLVRNAPENLRFDPMIGVTKAIAEIGHLLPGDFRCIGFDLSWNLAGSFVDLSQTAVQHQPQEEIVGELLILDVGQRAFDMNDGPQNVTDTVRQGRRHLRKLR